MAEELEAPPSFNSQLASLDVGLSVGVFRRILRPEATDIGTVKNKMRQSVNPAVSRTRKKYAREFVTDCGEFLTTDGHVIVALAVTRTE